MSPPHTLPGEMRWEKNPGCRSWEGKYCAQLWLSDLSGRPGVTQKVHRKCVFVCDGQNSVFDRLAYIVVGF